MADSVVMEHNCRPLKIPKLDEACEGSKSSSKQRSLGEKGKMTNTYDSICCFTINSRKLRYGLIPSRAQDLSSKRVARGKQFHTFIFRLKPTNEEIDSVEVQPPSPMRYEFDKPPIVFSRAGPEDDALPGVPFVFNRTGAGLDPNRFFPDEKCIPIPWP